MLKKKMLNKNKRCGFNYTTQRKKQESKKPKKYFKLKLSKRLGLRHVIQHLKLISQANYPLNSGSSTFTTHRNQ